MYSPPTNILYIIPKIIKVNGMNTLETITRYTLKSDAARENL